MKYVLLSLLCLAFIAEIALSQPENTAVSSGAVFDGEPYLAVNPTNHDNMVIAWMSYVKNPGAPLLDQFGIRVRSSFDGGITWGNEVIMPHIRPSFQSADVSMAFHKDGKLYLEYIDYTRTPLDSGVIVAAHSTDGGKSWSTPIEAFNYYDNDDAPIDRPWMVIDNSGTASDGTIYITTKPAFWDPLPNHNYMKYSTDGGMTWSQIARVDGGAYEANVIVQPMISPAVSSDGTFLAAYASWPAYTDPVKYTLAASTDKGATYTRTTVYVPTVGSKGDTLSKLGYRLAVNPLDPKNMIFVTIDARNGDNDVFSAVTFDGGATWTSGLRVNDDPVGNGVLQDLIWATYSDNGKCVISWRDRRNGDSTGYEKGSDIYFAVSTDGGKSFGKNIRLSNTTAAWTEVLDHPGNDFHTSAIINDSIRATWGDTRSGKLSIYFAKAALSDGIANVVKVSGDENTFSVYPNPAVNEATIKLALEEPDNIEVSMYDLSGKEILHYSFIRTNMLSQIVDLSKIADGIYVIIAKTSKEIYSQKFSVTH
jgi:hypothetical protein